MIKQESLLRYLIKQKDVELCPECYHKAFFLFSDIEKWFIENNKPFPYPNFGVAKNGSIIFQWMGKETNGKELIISFLPEKEIDCAWFDKDSEIKEKEIFKFEDLIDILKWLTNQDLK